METFNINVNDDRYQVETTTGTSLLWVLREHLGLTGTKYGCGIAQCGACTIHMDGKPAKACMIPVDSVGAAQKITTIEGLSGDGNHPLQKAWVDAQVPQCGYCQSGQIMQAAALLKANPHPDLNEIKEYMNGNLCRCGTYLRIVKAIQLASGNSLAGR
jgi:isoquinoline 1-oxidoreductase alpha subunit